MPGPLPSSQVSASLTTALNCNFHLPGSHFCRLTRTHLLLIWLRFKADQTKQLQGLPHKSVPPSLLVVDTVTCQCKDSLTTGCTLTVPRGPWILLLLLLLPASHTPSFADQFANLVRELDLGICRLYILLGNVEYPKQTCNSSIMKCDILKSL